MAEPLYSRGGDRDEGEAEGERDMKIKPKAKADRQASKKQAKINPAIGLPYGYTVRNDRKPVEGSPYGHTWVPQFIDPNIKGNIIGSVTMVRATIQ